MFRFEGLAEDAGKGMPTILSFWHDLGYRRPWIEIPSERYEFSIHLTYAHLVSDEDRQWLSALGGELSEAQRIALVLARRGEEVTNSQICLLTGMHPADVTKELKNLRSRQLLDTDSVGRWATYRLSDVAMVVSSAQLVSPSESDRADDLATQLSLLAASTGSLQDTGEVVARNLQDRAGTQNTGAPRLQDKVARAATIMHVRGADRGDAPPDLQDSDVAFGDQDESTAVLMKLTKKARMSPRLQPDEFDEIVIQMCRIVPLRVRQIAELTSRTTVYMRSRITKLVKAGRLEPLYPNRPNHPGQRYKSTDILL
jgi:DNA-binding transcriptional ArsR family regulator